MKYLATLLLTLVSSFAVADGIVPVDDTYRFTFNTVAPSTGAPITMGGTPAIEVYEDNSATQITAGTTISEDFDGVTGLHHVSIDCTAANGYEAGKRYSAVIAGTSPTADSVSIAGITVARFWVVEIDSSEVSDNRAHFFSGGSPTGHMNDLTDIETDTNVLQQDWADGGRLDNNLDGKATAASITALNDPSTTDIVNAILAALGAVRTTIDTYSSATSWTLAAGSADDDAYNGWTAIIIDQSTPTQIQAELVEGYVGSTRTITLFRDPEVFTAAVGDTVILLPFAQPVQERLDVEGNWPPSP